MHPAVGEGLRALPPTIASVSNGRAQRPAPTNWRRKSPGNRRACSARPHGSLFEGAVAARRLRERPRRRPMFCRTFVNRRAHEVRPYGMVMYPAVGEGLRALSTTIASLPSGRAQRPAPTNWQRKSPGNRRAFPARPHGSLFEGAVAARRLRECPRRRPMFRRTFFKQRAHEVRPYGVDAMCLLSPFYTSFPYSAIRRTLT